MLIIVSTVIIFSNKIFYFFKFINNLFYFVPKNVKHSQQYNNKYILKKYVYVLLVNFYACCA